jgi:hypothetical protein
LIFTVILTLWDSSSIDETVLIVAATAVTLLVVAYAIRSLRRTLKIGTAPHTVMNVTALP